MAWVRGPNCSVFACRKAVFALTNDEKSWKEFVWSWSAWHYIEISGLIVESDSYSLVLSNSSWGLEHCWGYLPFARWLHCEAGLMTRWFATYQLVWSSCSCLWAFPLSFGISFFGTIRSSLASSSLFLWSCSFWVLQNYQGRQIYPSLSKMQYFWAVPQPP